MHDARTCPSCGCDLPAHAPEGLCPRCLLQAGLESDAPSATGNSGPSPTVSLPATGLGVLDSLSATIGPVPHVLLRDTGPGEEPSPVIKPSSPEMPAAPGRLQLFGEIARGGMGAVLKGRDPDLGRDLAVKVLLEGHRDKPDLVRRFVEEAQIAGQLQHPGVVPVYELGQFADARPYFSMKLVKGRTLAEVLKERSDPSAELARHVATWLQLCQTVAYAHARGVIHRDLKPANVMLGAFGEVQVMDWGLAKVLPRGGVVDDAMAGMPDAHQTVIATARSKGSDSDLSQVGSVFGTPSYMAPEQARGETDRLDERCDVFALGSILCEILTGSPAFTGRTPAAIQRKAARGETAEALARLDACRADAELIALARDCLASEAEDRPRDAGSVATRGTAYLAGVQEKLRQAELQSVEERARRRLTTVAAAAVLVLGLAGGGGYAWLQRQKAERVARTSRAVDDALADVSRLRGEAQAAPPGVTMKWAEALSAARRAEGLLAQGEADAPLRGRVAALVAALNRERADAAEKARRLEADRILLADLESVRGNRAEHWDPKRTDAEYAAAFRKAGLDLDAAGPAEAGRWLAERSEPVELAGYFDDWAFVRIQAGRTEADWRRPITAARAADPDPWRDALRAKAGTKNAQAVAEFRRLADDETSLEAQPAAGLVLLARQLKDGGGDGERAARVLRRAAFRHTDDFWVHYELARAPGTPSGALQAIYPHPEEAVRHLTAAVAVRPRSATARSNLGSALHAQGKLDEAIAVCREAIRLQPDDATARTNLGTVLREQGKRDEAVAACREAIRLQPDDARAHRVLGLALQAQGKLEAAIAAYREAIRLQPDYAMARTNLGSALQAQGKHDEAIAACREAIRLQPDDAIAHNGLGLALRAQGNLDAAVAAHREAIRLQPSYTWAHYNLGSALQAQGKFDEAIAVYREAIRLRPDDAIAHNGLGLTLQTQGKLEEAVAAYREAIRLKPDYALAHSNLGGALQVQGKLEAAIAAYREAIRLQPDLAEPYGSLGDLLARQGDYAGSLTMYRKCHELGSRQPVWDYPSAQRVAEAERMLALADRLPAMLKGDDRPRDAAERLVLARVYSRTKRLAAAARFWGEAMEADPKLGDDRRNLIRNDAARDAALAAAGQGKDDPPPDDAAKSKLRAQALGWLKAERDAWAKIVLDGDAEARTQVARTLRHWQADPDLAVVRDPEALAKLPEAEGAEWRTLWAEVEALLKRATERTP